MRSDIITPERLVGLIVLLVVAVITAEVSAQVIYARTSRVIVAWDAVTTDTSGNPVTIDHYEVKLIRDGTFEESNYGTSNTSLSIPRPKSGVYEVRVRAAARNQGGMMLYSEWCSSLNVSCAKLGVDGTAKPPVLVEGPGAWKVYFKVAAPVGPFMIIPR